MPGALRRGAACSRAASAYRYGAGEAISTTRSGTRRREPVPAASSPASSCAYRAHTRAQARWLPRARSARSSQTVSTCVVPQVSAAAAHTLIDSARPLAINAAPRFASGRSTSRPPIDSQGPQSSRVARNCSNGKGHSSGEMPAQRARTLGIIYLLMLNVGSLGLLARRIDVPGQTHAQVSSRDRQ
jgi:hypothetical protein